MGLISFSKASIVARIPLGVTSSIGLVGVTLICGVGDGAVSDRLVMSSRLAASIFLYSAFSRLCLT